MDVLHAAFKKKVGELHKMVGGDTPGDDTHSALHDANVGQLGHKPDDGKKNSEDPDKNEDEGKAPEVNDDPMHVLEGGGDKSSKIQAISHASSIGNSPEGHDNEMAHLKAMSSGGAVGRSSMSLGERAKDGMKKRMAELSKK